ncbi:MAG: hypothetical protein WCL23_03000 [Candidatus Moraniibacteriota bacterium]
MIDIKKNGVGLVAGIAVIVMVTAAIFGLLFAKKVEAPVVTGPVERSVAPESAVPVAAKATEAPSGLPAKSYADENVSWYDVPKKVTDIKLFIKDEYNRNDTYQIWETGTVKTGDYAGSRVLLTIMTPDGPAAYGAEVFRFVQKPGDKQLYLLSDYSTSDIFGWGLQVNKGDKNGPLSETYFSGENYAYGVKIASLEYPGTLVAPNGQLLKKEDRFPFAGTWEKDGSAKDAYFSGALFRTDTVKFAFTDPVYGDVYTTDRSKVKEGDTGAYAENGFYLRAPDGTFVAYSAVVDLGGDVPNVTWNDGTKNTSKYSYKTESGCGTADYVSDVSGTVSDVDLIPLGSSENKTTVYGYKDVSDKALKDFYEEYQKLSLNENMFARYYQDEKPAKLSYEQFLQTHPMFFVKDAFGRIIRFINLHYIFSGGCGKPVIYLYPEKTENVSVHVSPSGGMSVSDPSYDGGWNVVADPESHIRNLADDKTYPYLFWEGSGSSIYHTPERGFVVGNSELNGFFDEKLAKSGLIQKEINDFKEYWIPKMRSENKPYYLVTFVDRATIDALAPLDISPKPDTVIRVLMDYRGLDEKIPAQGFDIRKPERKGFTAVEWGGVLR